MNYGKRVRESVWNIEWFLLFSVGNTVWLGVANKVGLHIVAPWRVIKERMP